MIAAVRLAVLLVLLAAAPALAGEAPTVTWHPRHPRVGGVAWVHVRGVDESATIEGAVGGHPLAFFPYAGGEAALVGFDVETKPGRQPWHFAVLEPGHNPLTVRGTLGLRARRFRVERLSLPKEMVDLDPETERRAESEIARLQTLYRTITPERLWRGRFTRPVAGSGDGTGFGARRVINGEPRAPHTGRDFRAPRGTPVVAANAGRVALVADFFFPGRLVAIDHGLGLYTLYFHLDSVAVKEGDVVGRGEPVGTVGATGRATGPHLHFAAALGGARIDPAALLGLRGLE